MLFRLVRLISREFRKPTGVRRQNTVQNPSRTAVPRKPVKPQKPAKTHPTDVLKGKCYVIDGDTIVISGTKIRIAGIDAPELDHPWGQKPNLPWLHCARGRSSMQLSKTRCRTIGLLRNAICLMVVILQQNWLNLGWLWIGQSSPVGCTSSLSHTVSAKSYGALRRVNRDATERACERTWSGFDHKSLMPAATCQADTGNHRAPNLQTQADSLDHTGGRDEVT